MPDDPTASLQEIASRAMDEEARLAGVVEVLAREAERARVERALVADWPAERVELVRRALQEPRFADDAGLASALAQAREELDALAELRGRLGQALRD